jgi:hypothetical protein
MPVEAKIGLASCRNGQGGTSESRRTTGAIRAAGRYAADQTRTALAGLVPGGCQSAILHRRLLTSGRSAREAPAEQQAAVRSTPPVGQVLDELVNARLKLDRSYYADLETEVPQSWAQVIVNGNGLRLQQLAVGE